ncbi:glutaredoxin [Mucor velutinosus]|uniref:Glutaredoxin n=1 Tax=Mucor velutinosus TaxID=708070 RepID=A0AAN7HXB0_9FUNG|nr:glutaredoxin [Mucor velutinosus]
MSISNKTNSSHTTTPATTWGLDSTTLDDWLENDLKQSSLFQCRKSITNTTTTTTTTPKNNKDTHNTTNNNNATKCSLKNLLAHDEESKIKQQEQEPSKDSIKNNTDDKPLPPHLIPLIKVYSLLNTIRQNEQLVKEKQYNKKRLYATPPPPSPVLSTVSSNDANCNSDFHYHHQHVQPTPVIKKKRGNNRPPVDLVVKRQRNTDAARRSRLRKAIKMETLEKRVDVLKTDNERLRVKVAVLETEVTHATEKEQRNRQRVLELEAQLAIAHKQLVEEYK